MNAITKCMKFNPSNGKNERSMLKAINPMLPGRKWMLESHYESICHTHLIG
ncbi:hypothetical protein HanIR_Chr02g0090151 [Helianthus annuus]|nr:hypothetical protein HanIR_Chr02g0090151 [Helianthus annuus]